MMYQGGRVGVGGGGVAVGPNGGMVAGGGFGGAGGGAIAGGGGVGVGGAGGGGDCCGVACGNAGPCGVACGTGGGGGAGQLEFVGGNRGSWTSQTQYRYVGNGCGEFDYVKPAPNYCICIVSSTVLCLLLTLLLWFLLKDSTGTTTNPTCAGCLAACSYAKTNGCRTDAMSLLTQSGQCKKTMMIKMCMECAALCPTEPPAPAPAPGIPGSCLVWGDPHVTTFDGTHADYYSTGEYWIVKSSSVWIQGKYAPTQATSGLAVMKGIAVGGPFLQNNKLVVEAMSATWNGQPILQAMGTPFRNALVQAMYDSNGATMQEGRSGMPMKVVHLTLPQGVNIQVNRWTRASEGNYINAKISMTSIAGMDGHCGNFNGNPADDARLLVRQRVGTTGVAQAELLFPGAKTPISVAGRPNINDCDPVKLGLAKAACKKKEGKFIPSMGCLTDYCFAGAAMVQTAE